MGERAKITQRSTVTQQWVDGPADVAAVKAGCWFDLEAATSARQFIERFLRIPIDGESKRKVVGPLFGWKREDGSRRFTQAYISMAKKNGKTVLLSAIMLYMLVVDAGLGGDCYSVATEREQAAMMYREAAGMVKASPELKALLTTTDTTKTIGFPKKRNQYRALSAEANSKEGYLISFLAYDELHAARNRQLFDALKYAGSASLKRTGKRPLFVYITTAGFDRESICFQQYEYAKRVLAGDVEDFSYYAFIAEAGPEDDWSDEATWRKANPSWDCALDVAEFRREFNEARNNPAQEQAFRRYRLNQWTASATSWIPSDVWAKCGGKVEPAAGAECWAGLDLASKEDLAALALLFPNTAGGFDIVPRFWVPAENLTEKGFRNGVNYEAWVKAGLVVATPGNVIDYDFIRADILGLAKRYKINEVAVDRFDATQIINQLTAEGLTCVPVSQGMNAAFSTGSHAQ